GAAEAGGPAGRPQPRPGARRAVTLTAETAPEQTAVTVLTEFAGLVVDVLVRSARSEEVAPVSVPRKGKTKPAFDSMHDQWLSALQSADGRLHAGAKELAELAGQVGSWRRPAVTAVAAPFHLCFRLEEPQAPNAAEDGFTTARVWTVRYRLQAREAPSLRIPAADAWSPPRGEAAVLKRGDFRPREYLLAALGQAASLSPEIETSLTTAEPDSFTTDATGAHRFLTE